MNYEKLESLVEDRLSRLDGRYGVSGDSGEDYFEVSLSWMKGSDRPDLEDLAAELLDAHGFEETSSEPGRAYIYCEEDEPTAIEVVDETAPEIH
ncbi:MAG: hypothetical protein SVS85_03135 [Candidatus Nanohaloarchaea archaeon]|nr:hypothetical protein [Candidatus Nanohaloarchaea archaeon]